ncbi:hypothetical protein [Arenibacter palladensis]|uniref:hypothetical protein n=1 Tax=Arenibacter palladensis TaxID=237373 RepID=UPI0026E18297|nr:hypothetical protein [Arenibacter palladensis]MDO6605727.1 hypothetical protein [Arenibacter palladensis]
MRSIQLFLCLLVISCTGQKGVPQDNTHSPVQKSAELQLVLADNYSGVEQPEFQVVRDTKKLKNFFLQINRTRKPGLLIPEVDFSKELLLIYCAGTSRGVGGAELLLLEVSQDSIVVGPKELTPSKKEITNVTTTPFSIYKMPHTPKEISFQHLK